ncbi:MAG TPA: hypothetical protein DIS90_14320 [Cytophagales bacterium]|nr:hypothetical protein [Cytophagales bacterium]
MSQFEIVEQYLTNRMDDAAKAAFEQQMQADPQLKAEVNFQKTIIEGVKSARVAELKAMLNNVPVGGAYSALTGKIALATISVGILGTALYFGLRSTPTEEIKSQPAETVTEQPVTPVQEPETTSIAETEKEKPKTEPAAKQEKPSSIKKMTDGKVAIPKVEVMDLTKDLEDSSEEVNSPKPTTKPSVSASTVEVELNNTDKNYSFHYQFANGKLVLYGPFDASLYEIIEINGGTHTLFLYYKDSYYHLDQRDENVVPLIMIRDVLLLKKLDKYRKKN